MNLSEIKKTYFVGIKGVGMTALAQVFLAQGVQVIGSDNEEKFFTDRVLQDLGVKVIEGFDPKNIPEDIDVAVVSAAYLGGVRDHKEVAELRNRNVPILTYAQGLGMIFEEKYGIAIAGTHGKSTTTAMLGLILEGAGMDPTVVVGTEVLEWRSNARTGSSEYLVAEADEYKGNFLNYRPRILVITNLEYDHPDFFETFQDYQKAFRDMIKKLPPEGVLVYNGKDKNILELLKVVNCKTIDYQKAKEPKAKMRAPGNHNLLNAKAALAVSDYLDVKRESAEEALRHFKGTRRRFEKKKQQNGLVFIDDYAHHPTEIKATLKAAKERYPKSRIISVFQPHTFTRTEALLEDFGKAFDLADDVLIIDICGSAREESGKVHSRDLVEKIKQSGKSRVDYREDLDGAANYIKSNFKEGVVLTMGAGDIWKLSTRF